MLQTAEEIIKYIGDAKKQTPIKMYLKGENLPDTDAFHLFGHTFRIQKTLEQQLIPDRIDIGDRKCVRHNASCRRSTPRSNHDSVAFCKMNEIPYNKEVIHVTHAFDNAQFIIQALHKGWIRVFSISSFQSVKTELIQIFP